MVKVSCGVGDAVAEVDLEREQRCGPAAGFRPLRDGMLQGEVDELACGILGREAAAR
jgi:hypothetical protein